MNPLIAATDLRAGYATGDVLQGVSIEVGPARSSACWAATAWARAR